MPTVYENFSFQSTTITLPIIIWGIYAGLVIAGAAFVYQKWYVGALVRALLKAECLSPDTAKTFSQLDFSAGRLLRRSLRDGSALRKCVLIANPEECATQREAVGAFGALRKFFRGSAQRPSKYRWEDAKLYVPEEKKYHAAVRYEAKGSSPVLLLIAAVAFAILAILAIYFIPELLKLTDSMISMFKAL